MSEYNVLIVTTGEIISARMARYINQLSVRGCTEECISCHFREVWHREMDQESVSAFLDREIEVTDRAVPNGETFLADGRTVVPNGILSEMVRLAEIAGSEFIAVYLTLTYPALQYTFTDAMVDRVLMDMDELWGTDGIGNPVHPIRNYESSGHRLGSLPITPVSPRNGGRPRTSHRTPPPAYSPGRPEGHPRQALAPIALLERQGSAPPYMERDATISAEELVHLSNDAPENQTVAPLGQSPIPSQTTRRPTSRSAPIHRQPTQQRRRPPPIITSHNDVALDSYHIPPQNAVRTGHLSVEADPNMQQRLQRAFMRMSSVENELDLGRGQPRSYLRTPTFEDETVLLQACEANDRSSSDSSFLLDIDSHLVTFDIVSEFFQVPDAAELNRAMAPLRERRRQRGETGESPVL